MLMYVSILAVIYSHFMRFGVSQDVIPLCPTSFRSNEVNLIRCDVNTAIFSCSSSYVIFNIMRPLANNAQEALCRPDLPCDCSTPSSDPTQDRQCACTNKVGSVFTYTLAYNATSTKDLDASISCQISTTSVSGGDCSSIKFAGPSVSQPGSCWPIGLIVIGAVAIVIYIVVGIYFLYKKCLGSKGARIVIFVVGVIVAVVMLIIGIILLIDKQPSCNWCPSSWTGGPIALLVFGVVGFVVCIIALMIKVCLEEREPNVPVLFVAAEIVGIVSCAIVGYVSIVVGSIFVAKNKADLSDGMITLIAILPAAAIAVVVSLILVCCSKPVKE